MSVISAGVCVQQEKVEGLITNSFGRLKPFIDQGEEVKSTASALSTAWIEFQICRVHIHMFFVVVLLLFDVVDDCDVVVFCVGEGVQNVGASCAVWHTIALLRLIVASAAVFGGLHLFARRYSCMRIGSP